MSYLPCGRRFANVVAPLLRPVVSIGAHADLSIKVGSRASCSCGKRWVTVPARATT